MRNERRRAPEMAQGSAVQCAAAAAISLMALVVSGPSRADFVIVQRDATPLLSKPSGSGRVLARVNAGSTLTVLGRQDDWLLVENPNLPQDRQLWVRTERVGDIIATPPSTRTDTVIVQRDATPLLSKPSGSGKVLARVNA